MRGISLDVWTPPQTQRAGGLCACARCRAGGPLPAPTIPSPHLGTSQPHAFSKRAGDFPRRLDAAADTTGQWTLRARGLSFWRPFPPLPPTHPDTQELCSPCAFAKRAVDSSRCFDADADATGRRRVCARTFLYWRPSRQPTTPTSISPAPVRSQNVRGVHPNALAVPRTPQVSRCQRAGVLSPWRPPSGHSSSHSTAQALRNLRAFYKCAGDIHRRLDTTADATGQRMLHMHVLSRWRHPPLLTPTHLHIQALRSPRALSERAGEHRFPVKPARTKLTSSE
ncbi:hypothetical protein FIBSPDRAFT_865985 [Athelia psychrophila]|uniref:Uncharacterized protein n=1 Tax=Athelia psychrophila TaxID=1759441 RepID=A0A166F668_9AGAM|nr:hypothetical protein FIBSPDRAFT_865985 [Fibularhizoctonia sp. CBS 109695]